MAQNEIEVIFMGRDGVGVLPPFYYGLQADRRRALELYVAYAKGGLLSDHALDPNAWDSKPDGCAPSDRIGLYPPMQGAPVPRERDLARLGRRRLLIPDAAIDEVARVFEDEARKSPPHDWFKRPTSYGRHLDEAVGHIEQWCLGKRMDMSGAHVLGCAIARLLMLLTCDLAGVGEDDVRGALAAGRRG